MKLQTSELVAVLCASGRSAKLAKPFSVSLGDSSWTVPADFVTDFASVPRCLWWIVPPWGRYFPAAVVHDWLYSTHDRPREDADRIFLMLMDALKIPTWRRRAMYIAVRLFGEHAWNESRKP